MRVVFTLFDESNFVFDNIVNIDISSWDEVMLSTMSAPTFKVTLSHNHFAKGSTNIRDFSNFWNFYTLWQGHLFDCAKVRIEDSKGYPLAKGIVLEWIENRERFEIELTCGSDISEYLNQNISFEGYNQSRMSIFDISDFALFVIEWLWLREIFKNHNNSITKNISYDREKLLLPLARMLSSTPQRLANGIYFVSVPYTFSGTKRSVISDVAQVLFAKAVYNNVSDKISFSSFTNFSNDPINITGFVKSKAFNKTEQNITIEELFTGNIQVFNISGQRIINWSVSSLKNFILSRLKPINHHTSYEIWGYSHQIIYSGQTILLDDVQYLVKDISYEVETLDTIKSFNATCIIFV